MVSLTREEDIRQAGVGDHVRQVHVRPNDSLLRAWSEWSWLAWVALGAALCAFLVSVWAIVPRYAPTPWQLTLVRQHALRVTGVAAVRARVHMWIDAPDHRMDGRAAWEAAYHEAQAHGWGQLAAQDWATHRVTMQGIDVSQHTGVPR